MEVILLKNVDKLGYTNEVVTVKPGYGRNFLLPQGLAVLATPSTKKVLAETLKQRAFKEKKIIEDAQKEADKLNGLEIKIASKSGEGNKLFGSVSNANLATALESNGVTIDKKYITIAGGLIKRTGQYDAKIRFHRDVVSSISFEVVAEKK